MQTSFHGQIKRSRIHSMGQYKMYNWPKKGRKASMIITLMTIGALLRRPYLLLHPRDQAHSPLPPVLHYTHDQPRLISRAPLIAIASTMSAVYQADCTCVRLPALLPLYLTTFSPLIMETRDIQAVNTHSNITYQRICLSYSLPTYHLAQTSHTH
ncbi:hypothetical protein BDN67DRAFT_1032698 [Paxillus ammoniavirescens]|nr:hypothetical protein BDN67DRAFT_1032698 [Paxillus ammoniavirescens]